MYHFINNNNIYLHARLMRVVHNTCLLRGMFLKKVHLLCRAADSEVIPRNKS